MRTSSLSWRIEESGDPSELASEHLLPVQFEDAIRLPVADGARVHSRAKVGAP